jgi:hypothetical protein
MWACGSDFQYQNADHWYHNLDKLIHYINYNASMGGPVVAFYSTPSVSQQLRLTAVVSPLYYLLFSSAVSAPPDTVASVD